MSLSQHSRANREMLVFVYRLALSQRPHHHPADEPLPPFADTWFRHHDEGHDATAYYSSTAAG